MYFCFLFYEKKINSNLLFTDHFLRSFLNLRKVSKGANFKEVQPMCISSDIIPTYPSRTFFLIQTFSGINDPGIKFVIKFLNYGKDL